MSSHEVCNRPDEEFDRFVRAALASSASVYEPSARVKELLLGAAALEQRRALHPRRETQPAPRSARLAEMPVTDLQFALASREDGGARSSVWTLHSQLLWLRGIV